MSDEIHSEINDPNALYLVGAATGLGAPDFHCEQAPRALWAAVDESQFELGPIVTPETDGNLEPRIYQFNQALSAAVDEGLATGKRVVVIGGDHSCAMGTWRGVTQHVKRIGLIWLDAHMDAHTKESSPSGCWHGMPVANLLGCEGALLNDEGPVLLADNLTLVGVRSYEPEEKALMAHLGVKVFTMDDVRRIGFADVMRQAKQRATDGTDGYGISIDLDGLDLLDAPGVGSPVVGGVHADDLQASLAEMREDKNLLAVEIVEFNPVVDVEHRTKKLLISLLATLTGGAA